jgi:DNA-directed RNA polymerase subunit RPC12/RpoP
MRVIKYPEPEEEKFITCIHCGAELAYTSEDTQLKDCLISIYTIIICPVCGREIILDIHKRNYQISPKPLEFWWKDGPTC